MKIFIGADHRGFDLKKEVINSLVRKNHEVIDLGTSSSSETCDYPHFSHEVARHVAAEPGSRGILICMTGIGHSIAANKVPGAYAALCYNKEAAVLSRQHNNSNILIIGSKFVAPDDVMGIVDIWLNTAFEGGRHERRISQIKDIERKYFK